MADPQWLKETHEFLARVIERCDPTDPNSYIPEPVKLDEYGLTYPEA